MWIWVRRRFSSVYVAYSWCLCVSKDTFNQSLEVMSWFGVLFYPCPLVSFQCLLCSSLCLFPFLLVACLSSSACQPDSFVLSLRYLTCPLPSPLTSPFLRLVISVSVYIVFVFPALLVSSFFVMSPSSSLCFLPCRLCPGGMFWIFDFWCLHFDLNISFGCTLL